MKQETPDLCVLPHQVDPDRPRRALDGAYLCHGHKVDLRRHLVELPARHDDLDRPAGTGGPKVHGGGEYGLSVDEPAADLRSQIRRDLAWWCLHVSDARGIHMPASTEPAAAAAWLTVHLDWLAADRFAAEHMLPALRELNGRAYGLVDLSVRRIELDAQCLTHVDGVRCTGVITVYARGDEWTARCPECQLDQDATPYLTRARRGTWITSAEVIHLAAVFGIAASDDVVRQWKHRRRIRGITGPAENLYDLRSVQKYLTDRTARERMSA